MQRTRSILTLALPIVGGMVSQNILNIVDLAMVGGFGDAAVAAVGVGSFAMFLATAFMTGGLSSSVQAMAARRLGEGNVEETALPLNGALILAVAMGVPASVVLAWLAPTLFPVLNPAPEVNAVGVPYLQARLVAMTAVAMNFSFRGYWNGTNRSSLYMRTLLIMHASNIALNWIFIYGNLGAPKMGATGAGIASAISTYIGTIVYFSLGFRHALGSGFLRAFPAADALKQILRLATPIGLQQLAFAGSYNALFWIIGRINMSSGMSSTAEVAAANAIINITLVALLPGIGFGIAAASLVGQALGREAPEDAYRWGWDVVRVAVLVMASLGLPMLLIPDALLSVFLHDEQTLAIARPVLRLVGAAMAIDGVGMVLQNALLGAGANQTVMRITVSVQWLLFLPAAYILGPVLGWGLFPIWVAQTLQRALTALAFSAIWRRRHWAKIRL